MIGERKKRIIILDDDPFNVKGLSDKLIRCGLEVEVVDRSDVFMEKARARRFDLFILDISPFDHATPGLLDGLAVARALRAERQTVNIPIVGITGNAPEKRDEAMALGMAKFFEKPFRLKDVVPEILDLLASRNSVQRAMSSLLQEIARGPWNVLEMEVAESYSRLRSSLVVGEGELSAPGRDLSLTLQLIQKGNLDEQLFEEVGSCLYERFFPLQVNVALQQCRLLSQLTQEPVRLLLRIEDRLFQNLPWEFGRYTGGTHGGHWLGGDPLFTCSRAAGNAGTLQTDEILKSPLRILVIAAKPVAAPPLNFQAELAAVRSALSRGGVGTEWLVLGAAQLAEGAGRDASPANVRAALTTFRPHVIHCMGHSRGGAVVLENGGLASEWSDFFMQFDFVESDASLLVFNSCLSADAGERSRGLAMTSSRAGVKAVIGHLYSVSDPAAVGFASLFYQGLAAGEPLDVAFQAARSHVWEDELAERRAFLPLLFVRDRFLRLAP